MSRIRLGLALGALALTAAACTSSTGGTPGAAPAPSISSAPVTSAPAPVTSAPVSSAPASSAPPSTASSAPASSPARPTQTSTPPAPVTSSSPPPPTPSSSTPPPGPAPCTADQLTAGGVRGGAYQGREIAGVLFTNSSSTTCSVSGYPFAQLRYRGQPLGHPASDNPGTVRTIVLRPGKAAQSQLTAVSTCQAPESDHVRVVAPRTGSAKTVVMQLRGCSLSIDPLEAA